MPKMYHFVGLTAHAVKSTEHSVHAESVAVFVVFSKSHFREESRELYAAQHNRGSYHIINRFPLRL